MDIVRWLFLILILMLVNSSLTAKEQTKEMFISNLLSVILKTKKSSFNNDIAAQIPNSLIIGMAYLESGYGTSYIARTKNNYFGMKDKNGNYAIFRNLSDSVESYLRNLTKNKAYANFQVALANGEKNPQKLLVMIAPAYSNNEGDYVYKVKKIISTNNLNSLDFNINIKKETPPIYLGNVTDNEIQDETSKEEMCLVEREDYFTINENSSLKVFNQSHNEDPL